MAPPRLIGLVAHPEKTGAAALVHALCREFSARGVRLLMEATTAAMAGEPAGAGVPVEELGVRCDLLVVLGGDGTILRAVHALNSHVRPVFGINLGHLGFLTCLGSSDYRQAVDCVLQGRYVLSERTMLSVEILRGNYHHPPHPEHGGSGPARSPAHQDQDQDQDQALDQPNPADGSQAPWGLNDAVISRGALSRLIQLETRIDGALLTQYSADGLIVATPTGSTAYSLSAGGPLLAPDSGVFVVTPICPHTVTNRSVIIGDGSCVDVRVRGGRHAELFLTVDGQRGIPLRSGDTVRIRRAPVRLPLAMLPDLPFFELVRRKLRWSGNSMG